MFQCVQIACKGTLYVTLSWVAWKGFEVCCRSLFSGLLEYVVALKDLQTKIHKV